MIGSKRKPIRILLINSHVWSSDSNSAMVGALGEEPYPPIGLLSIAASLRVCGYEVGLLDVPAILKKKRNDAMAQNVTWVVSDAVVEEVVTRRVRDFHPNVVGISCLFSGKFRGTVSISKTVKKVTPKCVVVIGGLHPTVFAREALERLPSVDFVIIGEGEESFSNLLLAIFENQMPLSDVDGLAFRDGASIRITAKTRYIKDLDRLPLPAWEMINFDDYAIDRETWKTFWENPKGYPLRYRMPLLTSRSCPMQCRFCAMHLLHGNKIRFRSVEHCLEEIEWLYHEFGVNYFSIIDDNFTLKKRRILDLADGIVKRNIQMYLDAPSGISMHFFDHDILEALKAIGMIRLFFAIESGSDYIREKVMCKNLSRDKIYEGSELVRSEKDILVRAFFVIGMPQETEETLKASWEMIKELYIDDVSIHFATPFPGTSLYDEVIKNDLLVIPPQDAFFADEFQQSSERPFIKPYHLDIDELIDFKQRVEDLFQRRREEHGVKTNRSIKHLQ